MKLDLLAKAIIQEKKKAMCKIKIYLIYLNIVKSIVWRDFAIDWETTTVDDAVSKMAPSKQTVYFKVLRRMALIPSAERSYKFQKFIRKF